MTCFAEAPASDFEFSGYLKQMAADTNAPVLVTSLGPVDSLEAIKSYQPKNNVDNFARVAAAIAHYEPCIDFEALLEASARG